MDSPGKVRVFWPRLLALREEIELLTGLTPVFMGRADAVAGWGHKPTADYARRFAEKRGLRYIALEDGFLRSIKPGRGMRPASMVIDRGGIYYDARVPSDLEIMLATGTFGEAELRTARDAIALLRRHRISKYNHAPADGVSGSRDGFVLVVDQTSGDASIEGGLCGAESFRAMLDGAIAGAAGREVVAKIHPDALGGGKIGHLAELAKDKPVTLIASNANPWPLIERASEVHVVSSQLGFEALMAGKTVVCRGLPFYAGWGATADTQQSDRRTAKRSVEEIFAAAYLRYARYFDLWTRTPVDCATSIDQLRFLRDRYLGNSRTIVAFGITPWKRKPLQKLLEGPAPAIQFARDLESAIAKAKAANAQILAWGKHANRAAPRIRGEGLPLISAEDGFLRSVGLGAVFTPAMSFTLDSSGIYYDPSRASDLETLLQTFDVPPELLARASALRKSIVASRVTKYNTGADALDFAAPAGRDIVLVAGQVADDEAVRAASPVAYLQEPLEHGGANLKLLREARRRNPDAFLVYKPHPDVEAVGRRGRIDDAEARRFADAITRIPSMPALFEIAGRLEVLTSLAGFEALMRGIPVAVHGQPFYAGWGLTTDLNPPPRRTRVLALDELAAIALIAFPRYLDPVSGLLCPVEVVLRRFEEQRRAAGGQARMSAGSALARARHAWGRRFGRN
jgi:capsular polysaccharide export protein